jgi:hypothetical protein
VDTRVSASDVVKSRLNHVGNRIPAGDGRGHPDAMEQRGFIEVEGCPVQTQWDLIQ